MAWDPVDFRRRQDEIWRQKLTNFAKKASDGFWYKFDEYLKFYGKDSKNRWRNSIGLPQGVATDLGQIIWAWGKQPDPRPKDEQDAEWPYREDCYPIGPEDEHHFYEQDQWHPPMSNNGDPAAIPGARDRECIYRKAFNLDLSPPDFHLPVRDIDPDRFERIAARERAKQSSASVEESESEEDGVQGKGKSKGKPKRQPVIAHPTDDRDRKERLERALPVLQELFHDSSDQLQSLSPELYTVFCLKKVDSSRKTKSVCLTESPAAKRARYSPELKGYHGCFSCGKAWPSS